jgi:hypothetical protein
MLSKSVEQKSMEQPLAFISHSSQDKAIAQKLASTLRDYEIDVWIDHEQIGLGASIPSKISEGLSKCDAILLLISSHYLQSRWCRAEYEPLLAKEIESGRVFVIAVRLDNSELPVLLHAKRYADFRSGITDTGIRELVESIGSGASYSGFERLVPTQSGGYQHSVLSMVISSTLREYPASALGSANILDGKSLVDLYRAIELLIERFQELCDEIVQALVAGGIRPDDHQSVYGSVSAGQARLSAANRKLARIASDMRQIASSLFDILPENSALRAKFGALLQVCATISVAEDFLVVEFGTPLKISRQTNAREKAWGWEIDQVDNLDRHDSWDNSLKLDEYRKVLMELDEYRTELRREIARVATG